MSSEQATKTKPALLLIVGVLMTLAGLLVTLLGVASLIPLFVDQMGAVAVPQSTVGAAIAQLLMHVVVGLFIIVLGIGSLRAKRWVPPLAVSFGWIWLIAGLLMLVSIAASLPMMWEDVGTVITPAMKWAVSIVLISITAVVLVFVPICVIFFYRRPRLIEACNALDPTPRWTDRCPNSVMPLPLSLALLAALMPSMAAYGVLPVFNVLLTGWIAIVAILLVSAVLVWLSIETARLLSRAWWATMIVLTVMSISLLVTFAAIDLVTLYAAMGVENMDKMLSESASRRISQVMIATVIGIQVAGIFYLLGIRKHFSQRELADESPALENIHQKNTADS